MELLAQAVREAYSIFDGQEVMTKLIWPAPDTPRHWLSKTAIAAAAAAELVLRFEASQGSDCPDQVLSSRLQLLLQQADFNLLGRACGIHLPTCVWAGQRISGWVARQGRWPHDMYLSRPEHKAPGLAPVWP